MSDKTCPYGFCDPENCACRATPASPPPAPQVEAPLPPMTEKSKSVAVALNMCRESSTEVHIFAPTCWDLALYVGRLEAVLADRLQRAAPPSPDYTDEAWQDVLLARAQAAGFMRDASGDWNASLDTTELLSLLSGLPLPARYAAPPAQPQQTGRCADVPCVRVKGGNCIACGHPQQTESEWMKEAERLIDEHGKWRWETGANEAAHERREARRTDDEAVEARTALLRHLRSRPTEDEELLKAVLDALEIGRRNAAASARQFIRESGIQASVSDDKDVAGINAAIAAVNARLGKKGKQG